MDIKTKYNEIVNQQNQFLFVVMFIINHYAIEKLIKKLSNYSCKRQDTLTLYDYLITLTSTCVKSRCNFLIRPIFNIPVFVNF